jgi:hypothetical protein
LIINASSIETSSMLIIELRIEVSTRLDHAAHSEAAGCVPAARAEGRLQQACI